MYTRTLAAALLAAGILAGCGTTGPTLSQARTAAMIAAQGKKPDAAKPGERPTPPAAVDKDEKPKQGFAARQAARTAERALARYADLLRRWERAYSDTEKDRLEQDMLTELHSTLEDVQQITSSQGSDYADREAYDVADRALDRYARQFREWELARTDEQKRRIVNEMLTDLVEAIQRIKRIA